MVGIFRHNFLHLLREQKRLRKILAGIGPNHHHHPPAAYQSRQLTVYRVRIVLLRVELYQCFGRCWYGCFRRTLGGSTRYPRSRYRSRFRHVSGTRYGYAVRFNGFNDVRRGAARLRGEPQERYHRSIVPIVQYWVPTCRASDSSDRVAPPPFEVRHAQCHIGAGLG